jgi:hypothetical protein
LDSRRLIALLVPVAAPAQPGGGAVEIEQGGPRPFPPATMAFRLPASWPTTRVVHGPASLPAQTNTLLWGVPVTVEILEGVAAAARRRGARRSRS